DSGQITQVNLRFVIGGSVIAQTQLSRARALEVLGKTNVAAIEEAAAKHKEGTRERINGELRGRALHYRRATLPAEGVQGQDNVIEREVSAGGRDQTGPGGERPGAADGAEEGPTCRQVGDSGTAAAALHASGDGRRHTQRDAVPEEIARRFVRVGDQFYFP